VGARKKKAHVKKKKKKKHKKHMKNMHVIGGKAPGIKELVMDAIAQHVAGHVTQFVVRFPFSSLQMRYLHVTSTF
jgi:hypothetical protein